MPNSEELWMLSLELRGSEVTACTSEPVPIAPSSTLASNGWLHEAVLELVAAHQPDRTA